MERVLRTSYNYLLYVNEESEAVPLDNEGNVCVLCVCVCVCVLCVCVCVCVCVLFFNLYTTKILGCGKPIMDSQCI